MAELFPSGMLTGLLGSVWWVLEGMRVLFLGLGAFAIFQPPTFSSLHNSCLASGWRLVSAVK